MKAMPETKATGKPMKKMAMHKLHGRMAHPGEILDRRFAQLMLKGDARGLGNMFASNATVYPPDQPVVQGRSNIRKMFETAFNGFKVTEFKYHDVRHRMAGGVCLGAGMAKMTIEPKNGGAPQHADFRFSELAERVHGRWVYTFDHVSAPMPMGGPPPMEEKPKS